jgi:hypothetical protein
LERALTLEPPLRAAPAGLNPALRKKGIKLADGRDTADDRYGRFSPAPLVAADGHPSGTGSHKPSEVLEKDVNFLANEAAMFMKTKNKPFCPAQKATFLHK